MNADAELGKLVFEGGKRVDGIHLRIYADGALYVAGEPIRNRGTVHIAFAHQFYCAACQFIGGLQIITAVRPQQGLGFGHYHRA